MNMKEIDNAIGTKATRSNVSQYILTNTSNTFQINQQQQAWGKDKYTSAQNNNVVAIVYVNHNSVARICF